MKSYLRKLKAYVKANPTRFDDDCPLPALDSLYWHYTECHTMTNEKTKQASRNLSAYLRFLPPKSGMPSTALPAHSAPNTKVLPLSPDSSSAHSLCWN